MSRLRFDALIAFIDNLPFRKAQVKGLNKPSTIHVVYPYGLTANAPEGALCVSWQVGNQESDRVAIVDFAQIRPNNLEPGEVIVSNYLTKSEVRFKANGDIDITANSDVNITSSGNTNITAVNANVTASSDVNLTASGDMVLTATTIEITGSLTNNGTNIGNTHIHSQGNDSNGDAEVDTGTPHS